MELLHDSAFIELLPTNAYKVTKTPILGRDQEIPIQMWVPIKSDGPEREIGKYIYIGADSNFGSALK